MNKITIEKPLYTLFFPIRIGFVIVWSIISTSIFLNDNQVSYNFVVFPIDSLRPLLIFSDSEAKSLYFHVLLLFNESDDDPKVLHL